MTEQNSDSRFASADDLRALAALDEVSLREGLDKLIRRTEEAEAAAGATLARQMLAVMEQILNFDDGASPHLVRGVLRIASGATLSAVERMALSIAGLVEPGMGAIRLTADGAGLIALFSAPPAAPAEERTAPGAPEQAAPAFVIKPFAMLRFGDRAFEIAEAADEVSLLFRSEGEADWIALDNTREAGWEVVGAEMLSKSMDVSEHYTRTHVIRLADPATGEGVHVLEIEGLRWWMRIDGDKAFFSADPATGWTLVPAEIKAENIRSLGIQAAHAMLPGFRDLMEENMNAWLRRMAHAAAIMPVMAA